MRYQNPSGDGCTACYSDADYSDCRQPFIQETGQKTDPLRGRIFCLVIEWFRIPENPAERGEYYEKKIQISILKGECIMPKTIRSKEEITQYLSDKKNMKDFVKKLHKYLMGQ